MSADERGQPLDVGYSSTVSDTLAIDLAVKPDSASWAREALGEFRDYLDRASYIDVQLMLSELINDAVLSDTDLNRTIAVRFEVPRDRLHVSVTEGDEAYELDSRRPEPGERGWGPYLTRILAEWRGMKHEDNHGSVWFQIPVAGTSLPG